MKIFIVFMIQKMLHHILYADVDTKQISLKFYFQIISTLIESPLSNEKQFGYIALKVFLGIPCSLVSFQIYPNVLIIH
jgi:hypothetical protein